MSSAEIFTQLTSHLLAVVERMHWTFTSSKFVTHAHFIFRFSIDNNGNIMAIGDLDYETTASYPLTVTAYDRGEGDNQKSTDVGVQIVLNNVPDQAPRFKQDRYETYVNEESTKLEPAIRVKVRQMS